MLEHFSVVCLFWGVGGEKIRSPSILYWGQSPGIDVYVCIRRVCIGENVQKITLADISGRYIYSFHWVVIAKMLFGVTTSTQYLSYRPPHDSSDVDGHVFQLERVPA